MCIMNSNNNHCKCVFEKKKNLKRKILYNKNVAIIAKHFDYYISFLK